MVLSATTWRARAAALTVVLVSLLSILHLGEVADVASYLSLVMTLGVLVSVFAAVRLWSGGTWDGRALAGGLCLIGLTGQVLNLTVGLPGASALSDDLGPGTILSMVLEVSTLGLVAVDVFRGPAKPDARRPYAL